MGMAWLIHMQLIGTFRTLPLAPLFDACSGAKLTSCRTRTTHDAGAYVVCTYNFASVIKIMIDKSLSSATLCNCMLAGAQASRHIERECRSVVRDGSVQVQVAPSSGGLGKFYFYQSPFKRE